MFPYIHFCSKSGVGAEALCDQLITGNCKILGTPSWRVKGLFFVKGTPACLFYIGTIWFGYPGGEGKTTFLRMGNPWAGSLRSE